MENKKLLQDKRLEVTSGHPACELAVIIVNYRTPAMVIDCLQSLLPEVTQIDCRILIVDNASGDDSVEIIRGWIDSRSRPERSRLQLIRSDSNGGFASGNNLGLRCVSAHYYLLLNSDTLVRPGAIAKLLEAAAADPRVGLIGPRLEFIDGRPQESCFRHHSAASEFIRGAQLSLVSRLLSHKVVALGTDDRSSDIDWTSFACVLIRGRVLAEVGLLDEGYFMYFEDAEYCLRARRAGWCIGHEPCAHVVHLRGGTSSVKERAAKRARLPRYYYESRARHFRQRGGTPYLLLANCLWLAGRALCLLKRLLGKPDRAAVQREWLDVWIDSGRRGSQGAGSRAGRGGNVV